MFLTETGAFNVCERANKPVSLWSYERNEELEFVDLETELRIWAGVCGGFYDGGEACFGVRRQCGIGDAAGNFPPGWGGEGEREVLKFGSLVCEREVELFDGGSAEWIIEVMGGDFEALDFGGCEVGVSGEEVSEGLGWLALGKRPLPNPSPFKGGTTLL